MDNETGEGMPNPEDSDAYAAEAPTSRRRTTAMAAHRHELLNRINQIIGFSELLQEEADERGQDYLASELSKIELVGRRLLELVNSATLSDSNLEKEAHETPILEPPATDSAMDRSTPISLEKLERSLRFAAETKDPERAYSTSGHSLLVVDDEATSRYVLARKLFRHDFAVCTSEGGREALETLASHVFDAVLLDVEMPEVDGLEVLRIIRRHFSAAELPVIMVTGRDAVEDMLTALRLGANDYLTKPVNTELAVVRIQAQLELKRARDNADALNRQLLDAQAKMARVVDTSPRSLDEISAWARSVSADIASVIGIRSVEVMFVSGDSAACITDGNPASITTEQLESLSRIGRVLDRGDDTLLPAFGLTGELYAILVVPKLVIVRNAATSRLLSVFARQLGSALELKRAHEKLDLVASAGRASRMEMIERGVEVLHFCPVCGRCYDHSFATCPNDGCALDSSQPMPYRIDGRYRLIRLLGEGGMGKVFAAKDTRLDREVALKVINPNLCDNTKARARFEHEARIVASLNHANIISIHDCAEFGNGTLYIVMELLRGTDLGSLLEAFGAGTPAEVADLLRQASAALTAAHDAGLVHRDIKPENFFLTPRPGGFDVKLLDFGLAKELEDDIALTATGAVVGTPLFMSPEQAMAGSVDHRTDIYSLATVIYYALTGVYVTTQTNVARMLLDVLNRTPPAISTLLEGISEKVDAEFAKGLLKASDERPDSVSEWVEGFVDELATVPASGPGWLTREGRMRFVNPLDLAES